jgi:hypothetical protein
VEAVCSSVRPHGIPTQNTNTDSFIAVKASNMMTTGLIRNLEILVLLLKHFSFLSGGNFPRFIQHSFQKLNQIRLLSIENEKVTELLTFRKFLFLLLWNWSRVNFGIKA